MDGGVLALLVLAGVALVLALAAGLVFYGRHSRQVEVDWRTEERDRARAALELERERIRLRAEGAALDMERDRDLADAAARHDDAGLLRHLPGPWPGAPPGEQGDPPDEGGVVGREA